MINCRICGLGANRPVESDAWICNWCDAGIEVGRILDGLFSTRPGCYPGGRLYAPTDAPPGGQYERQES